MRHFQSTGRKIDANESTVVNKSNRAYLREELSKRFIPYLHSIGFELAKEAAAIEPRSSHPFGSFVRRREAVTEIIDVQFDKYLRPRFTVNLRVDPSEHIDKERLGLTRTKCEFVAIYRLNPRPTSAGWFTLRTFLGLRSPEVSAKKVVDRLMSLTPEIEGWLKDGTLGQHLTMIPGPVIQETQDEAGP